MNKKIIMATIIIILLFLGTIIYILISNKQTKPQPVAKPNFYMVSITEQSKNVSGFVTVNDKQVQLDQTTMAEYAVVSFNSTYEIMWLLCPNQYKMLNPKSDTQNTINFDPGLGASIDVVSGQINNVNFICSKI